MVLIGSLLLAAISGVVVFGLAWVVGMVFGGAVAVALLSWVIALQVFVWARDRAGG